MDRHAREPARVVRRQALSADRIAEEEAGCPLLLVPRGTNPDLDAKRGDHPCHQRRCDCQTETSSHLAHSHPRCQYARIATYSWMILLFFTSQAPPRA